jgi:hypothetical protein
MQSFSKHFIASLKKKTASILSLLSNERSARMDGAATSADLSLEVGTLNYKIPAWKRQELLDLKNRKSPPVVFWTSRWYQNAVDEPVKISYATNVAESEILAQRFIGERVIGFDMEWKSSRTKGVVFTTVKENVSLIQLARDGEVGLFHIARHKGDTTSQLFAPTLLKILRSPDIVKTGVSIQRSDGRQLRNYALVEARGLFELSTLHKLLKSVTRGEQGRARTGKGDAFVALARQTEAHLGFPLAKGKVRTSDWTAPLTPAQRQYAADDAYVALVLYHTMNAKRLCLDPVPTLPGLADRTEATGTKRPKDIKPDEVKEAEPRAQPVNQHQNVPTLRGARRREKEAQAKSKAKDENDDDNDANASESDDAFETGENEPDRATAKPKFRIPQPLVWNDVPEANLPARPFMQSLQSILGHENKLTSEHTLAVSPTHSNVLVHNKRKREASPLQAIDTNKRSMSRPIDCVVHDSDRRNGLLLALQALLHRLSSSSTSTPPSKLITESTLEKIASNLPKDVGSLCRIPGAVPLMQYCKVHEVSLLAFVHEHG